MSGLAHAAGWCEDDTSRNVRSVLRAGRRQPPDSWALALVGRIRGLTPPRSEVSRVLVCGLSHRDEGVVAEEDVDEVLSCPLNR